MIPLILITVAGVWLGLSAWFAVAIGRTIRLRDRRGK